MNPLDPTTAPARRRTKPVVWIAAALIILALVAGTVGGLAAHADSSDEPSVSEPAATAPAATLPAEKQHTPKPSQTKKPATDDTPEKAYRFTSCHDVWAGGQGPFERGEPGYTEQLDPDGDGIACPSKPKD